MTSTPFNYGYSLSRNSSKVIQPPGGQTADIFGRAANEGGYSSASSQAGSDVATSRVHIETDQQSIGSIASSNQTPVDGLVKQQQQQLQQTAGGNVSPSGSVGSSIASAGAMQQPQAQQPLLMANDFKPVQASGQQQQQLTQQQQADALRTPKKTIPVLRRNPITGEVLADPTRQPVVRVRQPPGGRSSGIF